MNDGDASALTAGAMLRQAREASGMHVAALAVALKVPVRKLQALEEDRYEQLPDAVFARALAASVCRTLRIDAHPVLDRLPASAAPRLVREAANINAPFRAPGEARHSRWAEHARRPVVLIVLVLLVGALILVFLPQSMIELASPNPPRQPEPSSLPGTPPASVQTPVALQESSVEGDARTNPALPVQIPVQSVAEAVAPSAGSQLAAVEAAPVPGVELVVFRATGSSWVQVVDRRGAVVLQRLLGAGESVAANGGAPLMVTVGSASVTTVEVRGRAVDLAPLARDNVARFEVK